MSHPFRRTHRVGLLSVLVLLGLALIGCHSGSPEAPYDVLIRHGRILDGTGNAAYPGDIAIRGDRIAAIGSLDSAQAKQTMDASGLVVSPGFIDMLGQSEEALLIDNRSQSKLSQGITSEITGEGGSIAPQNPATTGTSGIAIRYPTSITIPVGRPPPASRATIRPTRTRSRISRTPITTSRPRPTRRLRAVVSNA